MPKKEFVCKPVIKNQAMQFKVADMEIKTETARQMVAHALTKMDMGNPHSKEAAIAKCYASDIAMEVASEQSRCSVDMDTAENIQLRNY